MKGMRGVLAVFRTRRYSEKEPEGAKIALMRIISASVFLDSPSRVYLRRQTPEFPSALMTAMAPSKFLNKIKCEAISTNLVHISVRSLSPSVRTMREAVMEDRRLKFSTIPRRFGAKCFRLALLHAKSRSEEH